MEHDAGIGANGQRRRFDDRVRHANGLHLEGAHVEARADGHFAQAELVLAEASLLQPTTGQRQRVGRAPHRHVELVEQEGQRADVILVAVGDDHAPQPLRVLGEPAEIRVQHVHAQVVVGEAGATVHHQDAVALLDGEAVHPHLAQSPERHETKGVGIELSVHAAFCLEAVGSLD